VKLAIVSDEISRDVNTAVELGLSWGIRAYEIRNLYNGRVPNVEELDIELRGLGTVNYIGEPEVKQNVYGLGKVIPMGEG